MYNILTRNHFENPRCIGSFSPNMPNIITRTLGNRDTDFFVQLQLQISNDVIIAARFMACGDPYIIAIMSYLCEWVRNKKSGELEQSSVDKLAHQFELPDLKKYYANLLLGLLKI